MLGHRRIIVHFALVALLLRGFLPAGWMPAAHGEAPLVMCSLTQISDDLTDGHTGDGDAVPGKADPRAHETCAFAASPGIAAPDNTIFFTPVLQDGDLQDDDEDINPVHFQHGPRPQTPRAPPPQI